MFNLGERWDFGGDYRKPYTTEIHVAGYDDAIHAVQSRVTTDGYRILRWEPVERHDGTVPRYTVGLVVT